MPTRRNRTKPVIGTPSRKALLLRAGFDFPKPWQACRATANERHESHRFGVGQFVLGHSRTGVNGTSYREPSQQVFEAVTTLPQPACFTL